MQQMQTKLMLMLIFVKQYLLYIIQRLTKFEIGRPTSISKSISKHL